MEQDQAFRFNADGGYLSLSSRVLFYVQQAEKVQKVSSSSIIALFTTLGLSSTSNSPVTLPPAVSSRSSTILLLASRAATQSSASPSHVHHAQSRRKENHLPGVLSNRLCGTWNCIVFGGLMPDPSPSSSESLPQISLSPAGVVFPLREGVCLLRAGVRTLTPGILVRRAGVPKISECSCGAGTAGEESRSSLLFMVLDFGVPLRFPAAGVAYSLSSRALPFLAGVRPVRYGKVDVPGFGARVVVCGVAWMRQFLSRMRCKRGSSFGVL